MHDNNGNMKQSNDGALARARVVAWLALGLAAVALAFGLWLAVGRRGLTVGYVRSQELMSRYTAAIDAQQQHAASLAGWNANLDTLRAEYRRVADVAGNAPAKVEELSRREENIRQYAAGIEPKAQEEEARLLSAVLGQINAYVERYGREHGYDLILGTTASGSLLYAAQGTDLTDDVLRGLNAEYAGAQRKPHDGR